jgi:hypothetical protein
MRLSIILVLSLLVAIPVHAALTTTVTNTNDSGPGSLRQAIDDVNAQSGGTIQFAIGSGPQTIQLLTGLPLTESIVIDGRTQPGFTGDPIIVIDGSLAGDVNGLTVRGGAVYSVVITNFGHYGIYSGGSTIRNCIIGPDITGKHQNRQSENGLVGDGYFEGNLIAGAYLANIFMIGSPTIVNNRIGTDITGNAKFPVHTARGILGGGSSVIVANVIGNTDVGITVRYASGHDIRSNYIGVGPGGGDIGNTIGILVEQSPGGPITDNLFANNNRSAIEIASASLRNPITGNTFTNNGLAIDLSANQFGGDGPTPNDDGDGDLGGNNLTNYPVITRATSFAGSTTITGELSSVPNREYTIQLFAAANCGDAQTPQTFTLTTNASGVATFSRTFAASLPSGYAISATATSTLEGTSELSPCVAVEGTGTLTFESSTFSLTEGMPGALTVTRTNGALGAASVQYAASNGTATAGSDYVLAGGTLNFVDGETSKTIAFTTPADGVFEGPQTFNVTLSGATGATLGNPSAVTVTIQDADSAPSLSLPSPIVVSEGNAGTTVLTIPFQLSGVSETALSVSYSTQVGTASLDDFTFQADVLSFAPGETVKNVTLQIHGDLSFEEDESFTLRWTYRGVDSTRTITILDDDSAPTVTAENISVVEAHDTVIAKITLQASAPMTGQIHYETLAGTAGDDDYISTSGSVTFSSQTTRTISIEIRGDDVAEAVESFLVKLFWTSGDFTLATSSVTVQINDDDIGVGPRTMNIPSGDSRTAWIQLGAVTPSDATFTLVSSDPAGFTVPSSVVMQAGTSSASFDVGAVAPGLDGSVTITFPASVGGGSAQVFISTYIGATLALIAPEGAVYPGQTIPVRASLAPAASAPVMVRLTSENTNIQIPRDLAIPAGGETTFDVKAQQPGFFTILATLPAEYGNTQFYLTGRVFATPVVPTLVSIAPALGSVAGGTHVDVTGFLLRSDCTMTFGGIPATAFTIIDAGHAAVTTPANAAGTVDVALHCGAATSVLRNAFVYRNAGPSVTALAPSTGTAAGGTFVRVTGNDFAHSCWPGFGGVRSPEARVVDEHTILAAAPPHAIGAADVTLLCTNGDAQLAGAFTFVEAPDPLAEIDAIEPSFAGPGEVVTIRGSHFRLDDMVTFGGNVARVLESTPESHVVIVPELPAGPVTVLVDLTPSFAASLAGASFMVGESSPPRITGITHDTVAAGAELELIGTLLRAPYTFAVGDRRVQIVRLLPRSAIVRLPNDLAPSDYTVAVLNANGQVATLGPLVHVRADGLAIDGVSRRCESTDGALDHDLVITGRGFTPEMTVHFGAALASKTFLDPKRVSVRVPANPAGLATITVTTSNGATATRTNAFRYVSPFDPQPNCSEGRSRAARH